MPDTQSTEMPDTLKNMLENAALNNKSIKIVMENGEHVIPTAEEIIQQQAHEEVILSTKLDVINALEATLHKIDNENRYADTTKKLLAGIDIKDTRLSIDDVDSIVNDVKKHFGELNVTSATTLNVSIQVGE